MSIQGEVLLSGKLLPLIDRYKTRISFLQKESDQWEAKGNAGACLSINGKIQAYNAVIKDLQQLIP